VDFTCPGNIDANLIRVGINFGFDGKEKICLRNQNTHKRRVEIETDFDGSDAEREIAWAGKTLSSPRSQFIPGLDH
jgi:hypothetical protein